MITKFDVFSFDCLLKKFNETERELAVRNKIYNSLYKILVEHNCPDVVLCQNKQQLTASNNKEIMTAKTDRNISRLKYDKVVATKSKDLQYIENTKSLVKKQIIKYHEVKTNVENIRGSNEKVIFLDNLMKIVSNTH